MNKIAQRRNILNKIREKVNAPGEAISGMISPEFSQLMDALREVDDQVREEAADLKDLLKVARSNFNRREYMTSIAYLGKFHEKLEVIRNEFFKLNKEVDTTHNEFLFSDLDEEHKQYLFEKMPERFKPKTKQKVASNQISKEADIKDWWHNLTDDRGKSLKYWEKRFPRAAKEIKRQTEKMLTRSEMFLNFLLSTFKVLASHRASRKLEDYIKASDNFINKYNAYDAVFNEYFNNSVKRFIDSQKDFEAKRTEKQNQLNNEILDKSAPQNGPVVNEDNEPTGQFTKPTDPGLQPTPGGSVNTGPSITDPLGGKSIDEAIEELSKDDKPRSFPKVPSEEYMEVNTDELMDNEPPSSSPTIPPNNLHQMQLAPTMPSPIAPNVNPQSAMSIYNQPIPKAPKVPNMTELEKPISESKADKFYYYTPPAPPSALPSTIRPAAKSQQQVEEEAPITERRPPDTINYPLPSKANEFINKLTKLSGENSLVVSLEIIKFAKEIEKTDKATSDRLLIVAKNLLK